MTSSLKNIPLICRVPRTALTSIVNNTLIFPVWKFTLKDEYIVVNNGTISWIDPTTGKQIRELKTGCDYTRFALSSYRGEIIYKDSVSSVYQLVGCRFSVLSFEPLDRHT
jgi:hypothetical protein